jgi:hypothetical protein
MMRELTDGIIWPSAGPAQGIEDAVSRSFER